MIVNSLEQRVQLLHIEDEGEELTRLMNRCLCHTTEARKAKKRAYNNTRRTCIICKKSIRRGGWSDHLSTKVHKRVVRKKKANQKKARETKGL